LKHAALLAIGLLAVSASAQAAETAQTLLQHLQDRALARATARAAQNATPATAPVTVAGTITITAHLSFDPVLTSTSTDLISCAAGIDLFDQAINGTTDNFIGYDNSVNVSGKLVKSGASGTCTVTVPYRFTYTHTSSVISISFTANGITSTENSYSTSYSTEIAIPKDNAKTSVSITASM